MCSSVLLFLFIILQPMSMLSIDVPTVTSPSTARVRVRSTQWQWPSLCHILSLKALKTNSFSSGSLFYSTSIQTQSTESGRMLMTCHFIMFQILGTHTKVLPTALANVQRPPYKSSHANRCCLTPQAHRLAHSPTINTNLGSKEHPLQTCHKSPPCREKQVLGESFHFTLRSNDLSVF